MRKIFLSLPFLFYFSCSLYSAEMDDLYKPLLNKSRLLYEGNFYYFELEEDGMHGNNAYDKFDSAPYIYSFGNSLRFSPLSSLDIGLGFKQFFPASYRRLTYSPSGSLASDQEYELDYFQDCLLDFRIRKKSAEIYFNALEKRQQSNWNWATHPDPANYFSYIKAHYEDFTSGVRYLSEGDGNYQLSNLSKIKRPLLSNDQINVEAQLQYKTGTLRRVTDYDISGIYNYSFFHRLKPHFTPEIKLRYGLDKNLELGSGFSYTTPFKYRYEYTVYNPDSTYSYIIGQYKLKHNFYIPIILRYQIRDELEIMLFSDFHYISQRLDYWEKGANNTMTRHPFKKLSYYNIQPSLRFIYLYDAGKEIEKDDFSSLTKTLLLRNQFLVEFQCQKDITHMDKNADNGSQNLIDPYNIFLYPLDYFVAGSEYSTFFTGNYSKYATNVIPQNYYLIEACFTYGLFDNLNLGGEFGYRSESSLKHFTLHDLNSRSYRFKPYYFLDFFFDWRLTKNSLFSVKAHFIPDYTTYMEHEAHPKEFKAENNYFEISIALRTLF